MKNLIFIAYAVFACVQLQGQLPQPFNGLNAEEVTTDFFLPLSGGLTIPPDGSQQAEVLTHSLMKNVFHVMHGADLTGGSVPSLTELIEGSKAAKLATATIPMVIADLEYNDLHPSAFDLGWVENIEGIITDISGDEDSPIVKNRAFAFFVDWESYQPGTYRILLNESGILSNIGSGFDLLAIDFDDGLGERQLGIGQVIEVTYTDAETPRQIKLRAVKGDDTLYSSFTLKGNACVNGMPSPDLPPWPQSSESYPWQISTTYGGQTVLGNAYTLLSDDGVFDKPFIFVEGVDFGSEISTLRNGSFGWQEFACGASAEYPFMALMPEMLEQLRHEGYDLILLDFADGADYIQKNSALLEHLINLVNEYKTGQEELVVAGASMGGQITRVALRNMELQGTPHCARLWISLDSPHCGANVPYSLQSTIAVLAMFQAEAMEFIDLFLSRPAARQMLLLQLPGINNIHAEYQAYIDGLGYPEQCRTLGIANGSITGQPLPFGDGQPLLDFSCSYSGVDFFKLLMLSTAGDAYHDDAFPGANVISQTKYSQTSSCSGFIDCLFNPLYSITTYNFLSYMLPSTPRLDNAPGGTRTSIVQFVEKMNESLLTLHAQGKYPSFCSPVIAASQYEAYHSFIPTTSALGIETDSYHMNVFQALAQNPSLTPFDRIYGVPGANTMHSEITPDIIAVVLEEVLAGGASPQPVVSALGGDQSQFNFAGADNYTLYDTEVISGGALYINNMLPLLAGTDQGSLPVPNTEVNVRTSGCGAIVTIGDGGTFKIGDGNYGLTGKLELRKDSELILREGGLIVIDEHSSIFVKNGAELIIDGGTLDMKNGARVVIEEGAVLRFKGGDAIQLFGQLSSIDLYGTIEIDDDVVMEIKMAGDDGGKLRCFNNGISINGGAGSEFIVSGAGQHDAIIEIFPGKALRTSYEFGALRLRDGRVNIHSDGRITTTGNFTARDVLFSGGPDCVGLRLFKAAQFYDCSLIEIPVHFEVSNSNLRMQSCTAARSPISTFGGTIRILDSVFDQCGIDSEDMVFTGHIFRSTFNGYPNNQSVAINHRLSTATLFVDDCTVSGWQTGIRKESGELRMRCSSLSNCGTAIRGEQFSIINLSGWYSGGYNSFSGNGSHIRVNNALHLWLSAGNNDFGNTPQPMITGTLLDNCNETCGYVINANGNQWPSISGEPETYMYQLFIADPSCASGNQTPGCYAEIVDRAAGKITECMQHGRLPQILKSTINNGASDNYLEAIEKLYIASTNGATTSSDNRKLLALDQYNEILSIPFSYDEREMLELRTAILLHSLSISEDFLARKAVNQVLLAPYFNEQLFRTAEAFNLKSTGTFEPAVYLDRVFEEAIKTRLIAVLNDHEPITEISEQAVNCGQSDEAISLFNETAAYLLRQTQRIAFIQNYSMSDSTFVPSISLPNYEASTSPSLQFGAYLHNASEMSYPICMEVNYYQQQIETAPTRSVFELFPNPASEFVTIHWLGDDVEETTIACHHLCGTKCFENRVPLKKGQQLVFETNDLAPGMYFITLTGGWGTYTQRVIVQ